MAVVQPFKGFIYNPAKVDFQDITCPPYDVINPKMHQELYERHPKNAVRLELPMEENRYQIAAERWNEWRKDKTLVQDERPAIYVYDQTFVTKAGKTVTRKGFLARLKTQPFADKVVMPHERTLAKAKTDRLNLFKETAANFSPIFILYRDPSLSIDDLLAETRDEVPFMDVTDYQGAHNLVWRLKSGPVLEKIQSYFTDERLYIADGHHRYETALAYSELRASQNPNHSGNEAYNFVMAYFTNMDDPDLVVYPTHRLVHGIDAAHLSNLDSSLNKAFDVKVLPTEADLKSFMAESATGKLGIVRLKGSDLEWIGLTFKGDFSFFAGTDIPDEVQKLDVSILHRIIFRQFLDISQEAQDQQINLHYSKDWAETVGEVKSGKSQLAVLMNPTPVSSVVEVCNSGHVMPQKSTFFYPKVITGISFHDLNGE
ncbi:MAG: DUF1015 domain-containing protein [Bacteroidetes bacterium]|nr:DUF1015 domain-containing protein [Bacteroidota bacterium]